MGIMECLSSILWCPDLKSLSLWRRRKCLLPQCMMGVTVPILQMGKVKAASHKGHTGGRTWLNLVYPALKAMLSTLIHTVFSEPTHSPPPRGINHLSENNDVECWLSILKGWFLDQQHSIAWELVRNANSGPQPRPTALETLRAGAMNLL